MNRLMKREIITRRKFFHGSEGICFRGKKTEDSKKNMKKKINSAKKNYAKKNSQFTIAELKENSALIMLCVFVVFAVLEIVLGILVWKMPVVSVCIVVLIEAGLAACLHNLPVWLHGIVAAAEIVVGIISGKVIFMLIGILCYGALFALKFQKENNPLSILK